MLWRPKFQYTGGGPVVAAAAILFHFLVWPFCGAWALAVAIEYFGPLITHHPMHIHVFSRLFVPLMIGGWFFGGPAFVVALLGWVLAWCGVLTV